MKILGIETSCDDTSVAIVDNQKNIISNLILSQTDIHQEFGGVVPELAARSHAEVLDKLIEKSLRESELKFEDLDGIAATSGPGLIGGVIVGMMTGKTIASIHKKPFLSVNHLEAHALTSRLTNNVEFPYLLLLVSGGHCQILLVKGVGQYEKLGQTIDDSIGESFDKVAQMMGLNYPGGPEIEKFALEGDEDRFKFPKPLFGDPNHKFNFSLSGLKTAVRREIERLTGEQYNHFSSNLKLSRVDITDICASFQRVIFEIIANRLGNVLTSRDLEVTNLVIGGGVAANQYLYQKIANEIKAKYSLNTISPPIKLCTDNAAMVAWTGVEKMKLGLIDSLNFKPRARWEL